MKRGPEQRQDTPGRRSWQPAALPSIEEFEAAQGALWKTGDPVPIIAWEAAEIRARAELELLLLLQPDLGARLSGLTGEVSARRVAEEAREVLFERTRGPWAPVPPAPTPPKSDLSLATGADLVPRFPPECHAAIAALGRLEAVAEIPSPRNLRKAARADLLSVVSGVLWALSSAPGPDDVARIERRRAGNRKAAAARRADRKGRPRRLTPHVVAEYHRAAEQVRRKFTRLGAGAIAAKVLESWAGSSEPELAAAAGLSPAYVAQRLSPKVHSRKA